MKPRGRSGGCAFPSYDGSLPRAVRSFRSRGEVAHEANNHQSDMRYFELLATVAGQVLQDGKTDEHEKSASTMQKSTLQNLGYAEEEQEDSEKYDALLEQQTQVFLDDGEEKSFRIEDFPLAEKEIVHTTLTSDGSETLNDPMRQEAHEGKVAVENLGEGGQLHATVCLQNVDNICSLQNNMHTSTGKITIIEGEESGHDTVVVDMNLSNPVFQTERNLQNSKHSFFDIPGHAESKAEQEADHSYCQGSQGWIKRKEAGCLNAGDLLVLDDGNQPLDSAGSRKDTLTCLRNKTCNIGFNHFLEKQSESRQEIALSKTRDDDDNSSKSFFLKTTPCRPSKVSFLKASRKRRMSDGNPNNKPSVVRSKRKHDKLAENSSDTLYGNHTVHTDQHTRCWPQSKRKVLQGSTFVAPKLQMNAENLRSLGFSHGNMDPSTAKLHSTKAGSVASSPTSATKLSWKSANQKSGEPHVKVGITSFTVPTLSVDLPETATVASLKRAVMEAAINLLGGGLHVRVLLQGKKVADESASLVQVGISSTERLDSLGFMLEPSRVPESSASAEDPLLVLSCAENRPTTQHPICCAEGNANGSMAKSLNGKSTRFVETDGSTAVQREVEIVDRSNRSLESFPCLPHGSLVPGTGALILHPHVQDETDMNLVGIEQNSKGIDVGKRRMRRPFSVTEVETLVKAVEVLGTGRWRDVKLCSFYQAGHRTYVDLKDKWKTLVHTASIAPHQRRGEPVPQELLDRVMQAHTYWAAEQAKQQADLDFQ